MESKPIVILNVSQSYFSVARYSGGARIQGIEYTYRPERDILIKSDWIKFYQRLEWEEFLKAVKSGQKPKLPSKAVKAKSEKPVSPSLFD